MSTTCSDVFPVEAAGTASDKTLKPADWACALGIVLCSLWLCVYANTLVQRQRVGSTDFLQEWTSAQNWRSGRPIYAPLHETLPVYFGPQARSVVDLNAHPPTAVALAIPFGYLPYQDAWLWWNVANLAAVAWSLWLLLGPGGLRFGIGRWTLVVLLVLSSNALKEQVQQGQLNGWLLLLMTLTWRAGRDRQPWASGLYIGMAAAIKLFPGFLILYYVSRRNWKACAAAATTFAALTALTIGTLGWQAYYDYVRLVLPNLQQYRTAWLNSSLHGFWSKLLVGRAERMIPLVEAPLLAQAAIVASCLLVVGMVIWLASSARSTRGRDLAFAVTTVGMLLVCPITWDHYCILLIPAFAILWQAQRRSRAFCLALGGEAFVLLLVRPAWIFRLFIPGHGEYAELLGQPVPIVQPGQTLTALACAFYALLALFVAAVWATNTRARLRISSGSRSEQTERGVPGLTSLESAANAQQTLSDRHLASKTATASGSTAQPGAQQ